MLFVISGPSGVGKSYLIDQLLQDYADKFSVLPVVTTRPPRPGEATADRRHISAEQFEDHIIADEFLLHGDYSGQRYGWLKKDVRTDTTQLTNAWPEILPLFMELENVVPVYLQADEALLLQRLKARGETDAMVARRMQITRDDHVFLDKMKPEINRLGKLFAIQSDAEIAEQIIPWVLSIL